MRPAKYRFPLISIVMIAIGAILAWQWQSREHLRDAAEALSAQNQELLRLRREHRRLMDMQASAEELNRLRDERDELMRLRAATAGALRRKQEVSEGGAANDADNSKSSAMIPVDAWRNKGRQTPAAAFQTAWWAAAKGDTDALAAMLELRPAARSKADALFAGLSDDERSQYGTPEKLLAFLLAKDVPLGGMRVDFGAGFGSPEQLILYVQLQNADGQTRQIGLAMHRQTEGWDLVVPESAVEKYAAELSGAVPLAKMPRE